MEQLNQHFVSDIHAGFYLQRVKGRPLCYVFLRVSYKGTVSKVHIKGIKVAPEQWNDKLQRAYISPMLSPLDNRNNEIANAKIQKYADILEDFKRKICFSQEKFVLLEKSIATYMKNNFNDENLDLIKYLNDAVTNDIDKKIQKSTAGNYHRAIKMFSDFLKYRETEGESPITNFKEVTEDLIDEFTDYLIEVARNPKNDDHYTAETINSRLKYFSAVFHKYSWKSGQLTRSEAAQIGYQSIQDKGNASFIVLRDDEIYKLYNYHCELPADEETKDAFLLLCLMGQRVQDFNSMVKGYSTYEDSHSVDLVQTKTQSKVDVPIVFQMAVDILSKYPHGFTNINGKRINNNIRRIARNAGVGIAEREKLLQRAITPESLSLV